MWIVGSIVPRFSRAVTVERSYLGLQRCRRMLLRALQKEAHVHYHPTPRYLGSLHPQSECVLNCSVVSNSFFCDLVDYSPPGFSVYGIFQPRILEWVAISYSRGSFWSRDWTSISCLSYIGRWIIYLSATGSERLNQIKWGQWCQLGVLASLTSSGKMKTASEDTWIRFASVKMMYSGRRVRGETVKSDSFASIANMFVKAGLTRQLR